MANGTYTGPGNRDVSFMGKLIKLTSENGPDQTLIDVQGESSNMHRGFLFQNGETNDSLIHSVTIRISAADEPIFHPRYQRNLALKNLAADRGTDTGIACNYCTDILISNYLLENCSGRFGVAFPAKQPAARSTNPLSATIPSPKRAGYTWILTAHFR